MNPQESTQPESDVNQLDQDNGSEPQRETDPRFRLDPARLPRRLDLTLPPDVVRRLEQLALHSGRDFEEIVQETLDRALQNRANP